MKADIWDGLKAEVTGSYNFSSTQSRSFIPSSVTKYRTDSEGYKTTASRSEARSNKFLLQTILHYNKTFGRHTVGAMAGYSMESSGGSSSKLSATQFPDNSLEVFDMADVVLTAAAASLSTPSRLMSYFGRVQYEYDDRYLPVSVATVLHVSVRKTVGESSQPFLPLTASQTRNSGRKTSL